MRGIYAIVCQPNGKRYIGSSIDIERRWSLHRSQLRLGKHHSVLLQRAWNKYGEEKFLFTVLEHVPEDQDVLVVEQAYLDNLQPGYNRLKIAGKTTGRTHGSESREKMRQAKLGIVPVKATEAAAIANRGKTRSPEVRAKIAASKLGKKRPDVALKNADPAFRAIVSAANKGRAPWDAINAAAEMRRNKRQPEGV